MYYLSMGPDNTRMGNCGVNFIGGFPHNTLNESQKDNLRRDLKEVKRTARRNNLSLVIATTIPSQEGCAEILVEEGFTSDPFSKRPPGASYNASRLWSYSVGGYSTAPSRQALGEIEIP